MEHQDAAALEALIVAVPERAGSALYGMVDVLSSTGNLWQQLVRTEPQHPPIRPKIASLSRTPHTGGTGIPVKPDDGIEEDPEADIVNLPELWLAPDDDMKARYGDGWNGYADATEGGVRSTPRVRAR
jgi:hypothetical protein